MTAGQVSSYRSVGTKKPDNLVELWYSVDIGPHSSGRYQQRDDAHCALAPRTREHIVQKGLPSPASENNLLLTMSSADRELIEPYLTPVKMPAHSDTFDHVFRRHMISHSDVSDHREMTPSGV
ncbi:hypothetical protein, partial [Roseovarius sp. D22-M7]|uniref:hypothetical protein n=1 Tax=Roseovarius sp. D22-M7 TaxID=3127116 RepID=UPI0030103BDF